MPIVDNTYGFLQQQEEDNQDVEEFKNRELRPHSFRIFGV